MISDGQNIGSYAIKLEFLLMEYSLMPGKCGLMGSRIGPKISLLVNWVSWSRKRISWSRN